MDRDRERDRAGTRTETRIGIGTGTGEGGEMCSMASCIWVEKVLLQDMML